MVGARVLIGLVALSLAAGGVSGCAPAPRSYAVALGPIDRPPSVSASGTAPPATLTTARGKKATPLSAPAPRRHYAVKRPTRSGLTREEVRRLREAQSALNEAQMKANAEKWAIDTAD